jgi:hypothetical protein
MWRAENRHGCRVSGVECDVSSVRCQVSGVKCRAVIHDTSTLRHFDTLTLRHLVTRWVLVLLALLALVSCGSTSITQTKQTEHYKVQLTLDGTGFGERTATIEVSDLAGQPVTADQVVLSPIMEVMGMASPEQIAQPLAPGRYQAKGEFFSMIGEWDVDVRVTAGGAEETARFKAQVTA